MPMPTDEECRRITQVIRTQLRERCPNESMDDFLSKEIRRLLKEECPDINSDVREVVGLMAYLGPPEAEFPCKELREELIGLAAHYIYNAPEDAPPIGLEEVVLTYGCKWKRNAICGNKRWDESWADAVMEMINLAHNFVVNATKILSDTVRDFTPPSSDEKHEYAEYATGVFTSLRPNFGDPQFLFYRSLQHWDPTKGNLYYYLKNAIQGDAKQNKRFQAYRFIHGLLFPLMKEDGYLDAGPLAFNCCRVACHETEYARAACPKCDNKEQYHPQDFITFDKHLLHTPQAYATRKFCKCHKCSGTICGKKDIYFDKELDSCPHCGGEGSLRTTTLMVLPRWAESEGHSIKDQDAIKGR
jgi:hypothetical protein